MSESSRFRRSAPAWARDRTVRRVGRDGPAARRPSRRRGDTRITRRSSPRRPTPRGRWRRSASRGLVGRAVRRRAAAGQPRRLRVRREGPGLRRRDVPPPPGRDRQPQPHVLARRRPRQPDRRRPRGDVPQAPGQGGRELRRRARPRSGSSRTATATARPTTPTVFADGFNDLADRPRRGRPRPQGRRLLHLHPRPLAAPRHRRRRQGRRPQVAPDRLRRPRRLPRPRPPRPEVRARRPALLQHRRPRPERPDRRRPDRRPAPTPARCCAASPTARAWSSSPPACGTRRSWPSTSPATCSPSTTTPTAATRPASSTSSRGATAAGGSATSTSSRPSAGAPGTPRSSGTRAPRTRPRTSSPRWRTSPTAPRASPTTPARPACPTATGATSSSPTSAAAPAPAASARSPSSPKGPSFELADSEQFLWGVLATDVDFGPDGALYVTRLGRGLEPHRQGPDLQAVRPRRSPPRPRPRSRPCSPRGSTAGRSPSLPAPRPPRPAGPPGGPVRPGRAAATRASRRSARSPPVGPEAARLARLHAVWGLGQVGRRPADARSRPCVALLDDADAEVRAQAAEDPGRRPRRPGGLDAPDRPALNDASPRVRVVAAIAAGQARRPRRRRPASLGVLRENADRDAVLRHAGVMGLVGCGDAAALARRRRPTPRRRSGWASCWPRGGSRTAEVARFLDDPDPRSSPRPPGPIYDTPIDAALPALAAPGGPAGPVRGRAPPGRAGERPGRRRRKAPGARPARRAGRRPRGGPGRGRRGAADWPEPLGLRPRDRPLAARPAAPRAGGGRGPRRRSSPGLLRGPSEPVRAAALRAAGPLPVAGAGPALFALVADPSRPAETPRRGPAGARPAGRPPARRRRPCAVNDALRPSSASRPGAPRQARPGGGAPGV